MTKMTYAQAIDTAIELIGEFSMEDENGNIVREYPEVIEKLEALKAQLAKRAGGKRGMTTTQKANVGIMETIVEGLTEMENPVTVTELINGYAPLEGFTNQKISALLRKLVEAGRVVKTIEKKKTYFAVA